MIDDKGLLNYSKKTKTKSSYEEDEAKRKAADIAQVLQNSDNTLSARERNKLKRKAKEIAKKKEQERRLNASSGNLRESMNFEDKKKEFKTVITEQPQKLDKIVIESVAD